MANENYECGDSQYVSTVRDRNRASVKQAMCAFSDPRAIVACAVISNMVVKAKLDRADIIRITAEILDERGIKFGGLEDEGQSAYSKLSAALAMNHGAAETSSDANLR